MEPIGFDAIAGHRRHEDAQIFKGVAKRLLALQDRFMSRLGQRLPGSGTSASSIMCSSSHCAIGMFASQSCALISSSATMRPSSVSIRNMRPGCRRPLCRTRSGGTSSTPTSRSHDDQVIFGHVIARGPQAIAIKDSADAHAVGKGNRGRAIPRFHQAAMIFVERLLLVAHALVIGPRLRNHHHHRVRQANGRPARAIPGSCRTWPNRCRRC